MAWTDDAIQILRVLVSDLDSTRYTDAALLANLAVAAYQVKREVDLDTEYTVSVTAKTITPDPSTDESFMNLLTLKASCIMDNGGAVVAANRAISVRDGTSAVSLEGIFKGKLALLKDGYCALYKDAKADYTREQLGVSRTGATTAGEVVMTPFRVYAREYYGGISGESGR